MFVCVATKQYFDSKPCQEELNYAKELNRIILPINVIGEPPNDIEKVQPVNLPKFLQKVQFISFFKGSKTHLSEFKATFQNFIEIPPLPDPLPAQPSVPFHPVTELKERLENLLIDINEQRLLLQDIRVTLENEKYKQDAIEFLNYFCSFENVLFVSIWKEAQELLSKYQVNTPVIKTPSYKSNLGALPREGVSSQEITEINSLNNLCEEILGTPFKWIFVPSGEIELPSEDPSRGKRKKALPTMSIKPFAISMYPVTNAQFKKFIDAEDGYNNEMFWEKTPASEEWYQENKKKPLAPKFKGNDKPRTLVSWYEANTFCQWLSNKLNHKVTLPTQYEWQYAGQMTPDGISNRKYPWGDEFYKTRCHFSAAIVANVHEYEKGASALGIMGMVGNVWEWCSDKYEGTIKDNNQGSSRFGVYNSYRFVEGHTICGGSFISDSADKLTLLMRDGRDSEKRYEDVGFRIIVQLT